jgi:hypothetical protein
VEGTVKITYIRIFASLPEKIPTSLKELNEQILVLLEIHNNTCFKGRNYSRRQQFEEMEKKTLQPLPQNRYELRRSLHATAMKNGHICLSVDKHYYSVPFAYIGKKVRILYSKSLVEIFYKYELIATHDRVRSAHNYTTDAMHMATQHRILAEWNPDAKCPGLESFHPGIQYLISSVCLICVVNLNINQNASFNIHIFTLLFVFEAIIEFTLE